MCRAFNCTPVEALEQPEELTLTIMEQWGFADTYTALKQATTNDQKPTGPLAKLAEDILAEITTARIAARRNKGRATR